MGWAGLYGKDGREGEKGFRTRTPLSPVRPLLYQPEEEIPSGGAPPTTNTYSYSYTVEGVLLDQQRNLKNATTLDRSKKFSLLYRGPRDDLDLPPIPFLQAF